MISIWWKRNQKSGFKTRYIPNELNVDTNIIAIYINGMEFIELKIIFQNNFSSQNVFVCISVYFPSILNQFGIGPDRIT